MTRKGVNGQSLATNRRGAPVPRRAPPAGAARLPRRISPRGAGTQCARRASPLPTADRTVLNVSTGAPVPMSKPMLMVDINFVPATGETDAPPTEGVALREEPRGDEVSLQSDPQAWAADGSGCGSSQGSETTPAPQRVEPLTLAASLLEASDDAIVGRTLDGTVFIWNRGAERMFGYRAAEMIGRSIAPLVPPDQAAELSQIVDRVRLGRSMLQYETVRLRKDGRALCVQQTVSPVRDATGQVNAMVVISRDVSELKRLQSLVLETAEQVQRRIGQDLHDGLSQQLSGIAYLTHLLHRKLVSQSLPEAEEAQRIVELVTEASHQARSVARGLLPVKPEPNGLAVALRRLAGTIERTSPLNCWVLCEPHLGIRDATLATHLYRIAQEAVHNAVKHSQANEVVIHLNRSEGRLQLIIEDDGRGWRGGAAPDQGMGLETMRYRARVIGATLRWRSGNGRGVRLVCSLPLASASPRKESNAC